MRTPLIAGFALALALTACSPRETTPDPTPSAEKTVTAPCEDVEAPPPVKEENDVQTLVPTRYCDETIGMTAEGTVECAVSSFEITVDSVVTGFQGEQVETKYYPDPNNVYGLTRINWSGPIKAHAIIVDGAQWAFVDSPSSSKNTELVASLLNRTDWGAVTADTRIEACGWMRT